LLWIVGHGEIGYRCKRRGERCKWPERDDDDWWWLLLYEFGTVIRAKMENMITIAIIFWNYGYEIGSWAVEILLLFQLIFIWVSRSNSRLRRLAGSVDPVPCHPIKTCDMDHAT
jgi:hypothetical protein